MEYIKKKGAFPQCPHNEGVCCRAVKKECYRCGWNPAVEKARSAQIRKDCS